MILPTRLLPVKKACHEKMTRLDVSASRGHSRGVVAANLVPSMSFPLQTRMRLKTIFSRLYTVDNTLYIRFL